MERFPRLDGQEEVKEGDKYANIYAVDVSKATAPDGDHGGAVLTATDVSRIYATSSGRQWLTQNSTGPTVTALSDVSLDVHSGELTVITGPSGSGKSTLLHLLAALDTPTSGEININGTDVTTLSQQRRTKLRLGTIGIVFQRFHLLPALTARGNVAVPLIERGVPRSQRRKRAREALEAVDMDDRLGHEPGRLSGGEQQRVAIARALISDPTLLIADEPTGELDTETGARIIAVLEEIATDRAVLVATHDQQVIDRADRRIQLRDGRRVDE